MERIEVFLGYLSLFIPPCFLLPLIFIPLDIGTSIFWSAGGIAAVISFFTLVARFVKLIRSDLLSKSMLVRPSLTVFIFSICMMSIKVSSADAREQAKTEAESILEQYSGKYPERLSHWNQSAYGDWTSYRAVGWPAQYHLSYRRSDDGLSFFLKLRMNIDSDYLYTVEEGVIKEAYRCC